MSATESGKKRKCGARGNKTGKPCQQPAGWGTSHPGEGRCKLHGGRSPRGIDHPRYSTGVYSAYAGPRNLDVGEVTEEEIERAEQEVVAAVQHARGMAKMAAEGSDIDSADILAAIERVVRIKAKAAELRMNADMKPMILETMRQGAAVMLRVLLEVGLDEEIRRRVADGLRRAADELDCAPSASRRPAALRR